MLELKHAHIVNISSMLCFEALAGVSDYAGSKAAVARLAESLDAELTNMGAFHIKTTAVFPYYINTKLFAGCRIRSVVLFPVAYLHTRFLIELATYILLFVYPNDQNLL